jgi:uncharacterized membrane protein
VVNVLSIAASVLGMSASVFCAYGKLKEVYLLSIVNGFIFIALNASIALSAPGQTGVALMIVPSVWMIVTAVYGLHRLKRKETP